jgi:hypothetical protein
MEAEESGSTMYCYTMALLAETFHSRPRQGTELNP